MKSSISEQLKNVKTEPADVSEYGQLPLREDVVVFEESTIKQWDKLRIIRKNLKVVEKYLSSNNGEKLNVWIAETKNDGASKVVLEKIGNHNDATGGISAYYLNLQNYYDQEEKKYDELEAKDIVPDDVKASTGEKREVRAEKRKTRGQVRKLKMRDLKRDEKGYLVVEIEEPAVLNADGGQNDEEKKEIETPKKVGDEVLKKTKNNVGIWIAGTLITITAVTTIVALTNTNK